MEWYWKWKTEKLRKPVPTSRSNFVSNWDFCNEWPATNHMSHAKLLEDCPSSNLCIKIQFLIHKIHSVPIIKTNMSSSWKYNQSKLWESHRQNMLCICNVNVLKPLNTELNRIFHLLILLRDLTFIGPCIVSIFQYISKQDAKLHSYLYMETALHVSRGTSTHHQELIQLYLQHLVLFTRKPPTARSNRFQLFHDSGR
jgi:hypothetical protein